MNHTTNYSLSQWEAQDRILMADFNADNAKIDAALKSHATSIAGKAAQADLTAEVSARKSAVSAEETARKNAIAAEEAARKKAVSDEAAARASAVSALSSSTNAALAKCGNCQIYYTTYTGDGADSRTMTFPYKPVVVFIWGGGYSHRAITGGNSVGVTSSSKLNSYLNFTWEGHSITWVNSSIDMGMNAANTSYTLAALLAVDE